jgi:DNA-binding LacI/PurR family transcriptional regulator
VALIGCDGLPELAYLDVPVSTVAQPVGRVCELGWELLTSRMDGYAGEPRALTVEPTLVLRESSAA